MKRTAKLSLKSLREELAAIDRLLRAAFPVRGKQGELALADAKRFPGAIAVGAVAGNTYGVWVTVRLAEGRNPTVLYLLESRDLVDPRRYAFLEGWVSALRRILTQPTALACSWCNSDLDQRMPLDVVAVASAKAYEAAFLQAKWLGRFLPARKRTPTRDAYEKVPGAVVMRNGAIDLDALSLWIGRHAQLGHVDPKADLAVLDALPPVPRALWYVFAMEGMVHNGGMSSFLLQTAAFQIDGAYRALVEVGAKQFAELIRRGVPVAADEFPSFRSRDDRYRCEKSRAWRSGFKLDPKLSSTSDLDGHDKGKSFYLIDREMRPKLQAYVKKHADALIEQASRVEADQAAAPKNRR